MKYTMFRFSSKKIDAALGMILHNTRVADPGYLRNTMQHNRESNTIYLFDKNGTIQEHQMYSNQKKFEVNNLLKQQLKDEKIAIKEQSKSFREKKSAAVIDSILTLSNSINDEYEKGLIDKKELNKRFLKTITNAAEKLGLEIMNVSIHYDEKTPHAHITFKNYYNGKAVSNSLKNRYKEAQDLSSFGFEDMGYQRGIEKEITGAENMKVVEMHQKEIEELKKELEIITNNLYEKRALNTRYEDVAFTKEMLYSKITELVKQHSTGPIISKENFINSINNHLQDYMKVELNEAEKVAAAEKTISNYKDLEHKYTQLKNTKSSNDVELIETKAELSDTKKDLENTIISSKEHFSNYEKYKKLYAAEKFKLEKLELSSNVEHVLYLEKKLKEAREETVKVVKDNEKKSIAISQEQVKLSTYSTEQELRSDALKVDFKIMGDEYTDINNKKYYSVKDVDGWKLTKEKPAPPPKEYTKTYTNTNNNTRSFNR